MHTENIKAAHLPVNGLLDLLGLKLANLVNTKKVPGVSADGNDLILDPKLILPPPHISGRVTAVTLRGNDIVQTFGEAHPKPLSTEALGNYMAYRKNVLVFGKLTMNDTDMILIDMDPFLGKLRLSLHRHCVLRLQSFGELCRSQHPISVAKCAAGSDQPTGRRGCPIA